MRTLARHPAAHFLALGAAIFLVTRWIGPAEAPSSAGQTVVVDAAEIRARYQAAHGRPPAGDETAVLIEGAVVDEILYREAIARGFDTADAVVERRLVQNMRFLDDGDEKDASLLLRQAHALGLRDGDPVIRRRLIQRMRSALADESGLLPPSPAEVTTYFDRHREQFAEPAQVRLSQIAFLSPDAEHRAKAVLAALERTGAPSDAAAAYGDPFISGAKLPLQSERGLAKIFGPDLAREVLSLPVGRWSGPLRSTYGVHLVWVHERQAARVPPLAAVAHAVRRRLEAEREEAAVRAAIAGLRDTYRIEVDTGDD